MRISLAIIPFSSRCVSGRSLRLLTKPYRKQALAQKIREALDD